MRGQHHFFRVGRLQVRIRHNGEVSKTAAVLLVFAMQLGPLSIGRSAELRPDEQLIFFPTLGSLSEDGKHWLLPIHGWVFEPEDNDLFRRVALKRFAQLLGLSEHEAEHTLFRKRAARFLVDNERGKQIRIQIGDHAFPLQPSDKDGHFFGNVRVEVDQIEPSAVAGWISYHAVLPAADRRLVRGPCATGPQARTVGDQRY